MSYMVTNPGRPAVLLCSLCQVYLYAGSEHEHEKHNPRHTLKKIIEGHVAPIRDGSTPEIDYRALLVRYMQAVLNTEGNTFVDYHLDHVNPQSNLTEADVKELQRIERELLP